MIDLLLAIAAFSAAVLRLTSRRAPAGLALACALASTLLLAASLAALHLVPPSFAYVAWPSAAASAGLQGAGTVTEAGGVPVSSAGSLLARAAADAGIELRAGKAFTRQLPRSDGWMFWRATDSYDLEELLGGLVLFPRRPVLSPDVPVMGSQVRARPPAGIRVVSVGGVPAPDLAAFLGALRELPQKGVAPMLVMDPTPDGGTATVYYSPTGFLPPPGAGDWNAEEYAQFHLGLSGTPTLVHLPGEPNRPFDFRGYATKTFAGPNALDAELAEHPEFRYAAFPVEATVLVRPRLGLLPRLYGNPLLTFAAGVAGNFVRPLLQLPDLYYVALFWKELPRQYYALDDSLSLPFLLFRLGSFAACLALAFGLRQLIARREQLPVWLRGLRFTFGCVLLLQLADLFRIRPY